MKISASSSASARPSTNTGASSGSTPPRSSFALRGHSVALDPQRFAVRRDLADIRLADRVFAPHYAAAVQRVVTAPSALRETPDTTSSVLAELAPGDVFEVLEFVTGRAWGRAPGHDLVGYVAAESLSRPVA